MRRAVGSAAISSLFLFLLALPLLHLHPGVRNTLSAVIHCHMPHDAEVHHGGTAADPALDVVDSDELQAVPFEISALCGAAPAQAQAPVPDYSAIIALALPIEPEMPCVSFKEPDPKAKAPPAILNHPSLRSPPA